MTVDLIILGILGISTLLGLFRGVVKEAISLIVWITAFWVSIFHSNEIAEALTFISNAYLRNLIAGSGAFFAILIIGAIISFIITSILRLGGLGGFDRTLGMAFGFVRGLIIVIVGIFLVQFTPITEFEEWHTSKLAPILSQASDVITENLPQSWKNKATEYLH